MPATVQGIIFVGAAVLLTLVGMALVRRLVTPRTLADHNDVAGFVYATTGVTYAVILAFVVIAVWEQYDDARRVADGESDAVSVLYRLANGFSEPVRQVIQPAILDYAQAVVEEEWPAMAAGRRPPRGRRPRWSASTRSTPSLSW